MEQFRQYLESVGMLTPLITATFEVIKLASNLCGGAVTYLFVEDSIDSQKQKNFPSLYCYTANGLVANVQGFPANPIFVVSSVNKRYQVLRVVATNYEFEKANEQSTLEVYFAADGMSGTMRATSANCERLLTVLRVYVWPRV